MYLPAGYEDSDEDEFDEYGYITDFNPSLKKKKNWLNVEQKSHTDDYDTLLYNAVLDGDLEEVKRCLQQTEHLRSGACLRQGWPVLFYACFEANLAIVQYLVEEVEVDVRRPYNLQTALMIACSSTKPTEQVYPVVRLLVEHGSIIGVLDSYDWSPLMFACKEGHLEVVKEIIGESSLQSVDNDGNTALFHAVRNNRYEIVKVLLRAGAPTNIVNREGFTPKQYAADANYNDIEELLPTEEDEYEVPVKYLSYSHYRNFVHGETEQDAPDYFPELHRILYGMNSERNAHFFIKANINLFDLLTMTDDRLRELGIKYPIERKRILLGLYDFHQHPWTNKSIRTVSKPRVLDCYDIQQFLANTLRQLTIIYSSLVHAKQITSGADANVFMNVVQESQLSPKIKNLRSILISLQRQMDEIHKISPRKPVLYVEKQNTTHKTKLKAFKYCVCLFPALVVVYLKFKT